MAFPTRESCTISEIRPNDRRGMAELERLLQAEGIKKDGHLDYTAGLYDDEGRLIGTGSCYANTLRCLALDGACRGEGFMNTIVSHLVDYQMTRGHSHLFLYTKGEAARLFESLGFFEIARAGEQAVFLENRKDGFASFLNGLTACKADVPSAALVMNCNPFTLGHRWLVERAASENGRVHLFVVSEDASVFPFADRYALVKAGCADLPNVVLHETKSYLVSQAVFPSYFLFGSESVAEAQARIDAALFARIAETLGVTKRYVGTEPFSKVTGIYNGVMQQELPKSGVECIVVPRKETGGQPISASRVRQLIRDGRTEEIRPLVPQSTYEYFLTEAGMETIRRIKDC